MRIDVKADDPRKIAEQLGKDIRSAFRTGVDGGTTGLKEELRKQVRSAGLGEKLAKAWQSEVYPRKGVETFNPAGVVFSKARTLHRVYDEGAIIRSKHGRFLAVPTQYVIRRQNKKVTPADFEEAGIKLRFVPPAGSRKVGLLVADDFRVNGKGRARYGSQTARSTGRGLATLVMFILIPQARVKKRLNIDAAGRVWLAKLPGLIEYELYRKT